MKLTIKLLSLFTILYFTGCKEIQNVNIDYSSSTAEFTIDAGTNGTVNETSSFDINLSEIASNNGTNIDKVKSVKLKTAKVTSTNGVNYDEFENIKISIEASGLEKVVLVNKNPVNSNGATTVDLDVDQNLDLLPYFKSNTINIHFEGSTNAATSSDNTTKVDLTYVIEAELI